MSLLLNMVTGLGAAQCCRGPVLEDPAAGGSPGPWPCHEDVGVATPGSGQLCEGPGVTSQQARMAGSTHVKILPLIFPPLQMGTLWMNIQDGSAPVFFVLCNAQLISIAGCPPLSG